MSKEDVQEFYSNFKKASGKMQQALPEMVKGFGGLFAAVMKDGALDLKSKELIALAVGLAVRCTPCINLHVQKCLAAGATREEILDAAAVVVMMQGGPSFTYVPAVIEALEANEYDDYYDVEGACQKTC
ncbi:MAG: carboxymuconolactone decarboxylase family protein [Sedimentisphaerales bacterium]|nr:carboxymuconolactone decarboxylase family protein [Sedimentisphaerales bacterium]